MTNQVLPSKPTSQGGDEIVVFSGLHHTLNGTIWVTNTHTNTPEGLHWELRPGDNFLAAELWAELRDLPQIKSRLDHGELKPKYEGKLADLENLLAPAPRSYIRRLSAKAVRIPDGQLYDRNQQFRSLDSASESRLRALEQQFAALRNEG